MRSVKRKYDSLSLYNWVSTLMVYMFRSSGIQKINASITKPWAPNSQDRIHIKGLKMNPRHDAHKRVKIMLSMRNWSFIHV